jgi:hypothetical protein
MPTFAENIVACYSRASASERDAGMTWYSTAHALALELSPNDVWRGAGVISILSVREKWDQNVINARRAFATGIVSGNTKALCALGQRILDGEHTLDVLQGDKTRAFAAAIATNGASDIATIDRHAYDIAFGKVFPDKGRPPVGKRLYRELVFHYQQAALDQGITTNQIQAVTWIRWRNEKGIK